MLYKKKCSENQNSQVNTRSNHLELLYEKGDFKISLNSQKNIFDGVPFLTKLQPGNLKLSESATGGVL